MGKTYTVPRNVKGETRLLYIFSVKSLITTIIGAAFGLPFFFILSKMEMTIVGIIVILLLAAIGYGVGVLTIPDTPLFGNLRKAGGEKVSDILIRTITFQKRKKIYIYRYADKLKEENIKKAEITNNNENNDQDNNSNTSGKKESEVES